MSDFHSANNIFASEWDKEQSSFSVFAARKRVPLIGAFELTPRCNLNCKMCYIRMSASEMEPLGRELTAEEWISIAQEASRAGTLSILITGGEPLLRHDFGEIYSRLCEMGFIISINTNASLMDEKYFELFSRLPPTAINVTLYGASPETYEKVCGSAQAYDNTVRGLEMISKLPTNLEVRTTFVRDNATELDAIRALADRYTARFAINNLVTKPIRGAKSDAEAVRMTPEQALDVDVSNYLYYENLRARLHAEHAHELEEHDHENDKEPEDQQVDYARDVSPTILGCLAAKSSYFITWDGKMIPCGNFTIPYTEPMQDGFSAAWNRLHTLLDDISVPEECKDCELLDYCPNCPCNLYAETGALDRKSQYLCDLAKERTRRYGEISQ